MNFEAPTRDKPANDSGAAEMVLRPVISVLAPETIAIVGVSDRGEGGWSKIMFDNLKDAGFPAKVYLINPKRDEIWGEKCYPNFAAIGAPVDHTLMMVPAPAVCDSLREAALADTKVAAAIEGKTIRKVIVVKGRLINIVAV